MEIAKMLNTTILACLLILTGCLGLFDDDDVIDDADAQSGGTSSGTVPMIDTQQIGDIVFEGSSGYTFSVYWAVLDLDGSVTSAGFDTDLDGAIDVSVSGRKGVTNLTIPLSEWTIINYREALTTVAFIAIDDDSNSIGKLVTVNTMDAFVGDLSLSAGDHTDDIEDDVGMMTLTFGNGNNLDWALVQIEIVKDSVPTTCDNPSAAGGKCVASQHGGADQTSWEKGETVIITSTGGGFCLDADCTLTVRVKYNGDVVMTAAVHMI